MSKQTNKPIALAVGAALVGGLALSASAFAMTDLSSGYMVASAAAGEPKAGEGKCGEGKCGMEKMDADKDGKISSAEFGAAHKGDTSKFAAHDTNKDGFVTADELKAHKAVPKASAAARRRPIRRRPTWKASAAKASAAAWPEHQIDGIRVLRAVPSYRHMIASLPPSSAGLGLRRALLGPLQAAAAGRLRLPRMRPGELDRRRRQARRCAGGARRETSARLPRPVTVAGRLRAAGRNLPRARAPLPRSPPRGAVQRTPELLRRRRPSLRPAADPVHRGSRAPRRRANPPGPGHRRPPHRGGERLLLRRATRRRGPTGAARDRLHQRRAGRSRLRPAARRQQHLRQRDQPALRRPRIPVAAAGRPRRPTSMSPATTTKPTISRSTPMAHR